VAEIAVVQREGKGKKNVGRPIGGINDQRITRVEKPTRDCSQPGRHGKKRKK